MKYNTVQDKTRQHKTIRGNPTHYIIRPSKAIQDKSIHDNTKQYNMRQDKTRQTNTIQCNIIKHKTRQDKTIHDKAIQSNTRYYNTI